MLEEFQQRLQDEEKKFVFACLFKCLYIISQGHYHIPFTYTVKN